MIMIAHKIYLTMFSFKLDKINIEHLVFQLVYCVGGSSKNVCHFKLGGGGGGGSGKC